jgi:type III secretory pathway component EscU
MDPAGIVIGATGLVMAGGVVFFVTRSASRGDIEANAAIGIRTRLTRSSQQAWETAHRAALPYATAACLHAVATAVLSVTAVVLADTVGSSSTAPGVVLAAGYAGFLGVMVLATRAGNRAVRDLPGASG